MAPLSRYGIVSNRDGTFVVVNHETGTILSTHLRFRRAVRCTERLNKRVGVALQPRDRKGSVIGALMARGDGPPGVSRPVR